MAIPYQNQGEIIKLYLNGKPVSQIAKQFNTSPATVNKVINSPEQRLEIEKKYFTLAKARENRKIDESKNQIIDFIDAAVKEAKDQPGKIGFIKDIKEIIGELDRISRLNSGEVTERTESTTKNVEYDVAKLMNNLKSEEDKKRFLQSQLNK